MNKTISIITFLSCFLITTVASFAQDYTQLREELIKKQEHARAEINDLDRQIDKFAERLKLAEQKYEALYSKYEDLKRVIALQNEKLSKLQTEQSHIEEEIEVTTQSLNEKRDELNQLIENYKSTLGYLYKHGRTSELALIFSASSINQMLVRAYYLEKFNTYREEQARQIRETEKELENTRKELEEARTKNANVLAEIREEKDQLNEKMEQQERNVTLLRENRQEVQRKLQEVQQQKERLNNTLSALILQEEKVRKAQEEEIRRQEEERKRNLAAAQKIENEDQREKEVAKYSSPVERSDFLNDEKLKEVEQMFASKKGQLSWPVNSNTISEKFGRRRHPVYGTQTENPGVVIVADSAEVVRVVHDGYVFEVRPLTGFGDVVFVSHGTYKTVYGNLSKVSVRKNQVLEAGDIIGNAGDEDSPKGESVFFMIREGTQNLDPSTWLSQPTAAR